MSELDWPRLIKQQSQYIQQDNRIERQRKQMLKELYRKDLQRMIKQQSFRSQEQKINDLRIIKQASQRERIKVITQERQARQKQIQKIQMARTNIKSLQQRKTKMNKQSQQVKDFYYQKYRKMNTQLKQQSIQKLKNKQHQRRSLSKSYDRQINQQKNRELMQKLQDEKYVQLREQLQQKKQQNRKYYINRHNNFRQNPQVYKLSKLLSEEKQKIKINFLKKLQQQEPTSFLQKEKPRIKRSQQKIRNIIQASKFNRNFFENRIMSQKINNLKENAQYAQINRTIEEQNNYQKEMKLRQLQSRKIMLKDQLDRQIIQSQTRNSRRNILNRQQQRINRSGNILTVPGLAKDYSNEKKFNIMKNFLGDSSKSFSPYL